ncbi:hypothetical protein E2C01_096528 [Portunus trituberculatus]|uniref:Uncharacterized protein n=1 Tax=Portunus trituberculatus TaxID=210409 RepID=A0A5B7K727_PORTR|nr:hypothetical protein [Portunus trituberculatus]
MRLGQSKSKSRPRARRRRLYKAECSSARHSLQEHLSAAGRKYSRGN